MSGFLGKLGRLVFGAATVGKIFVGFGRHTSAQPHRTIDPDNAARAVEAIVDVYFTGSTSVSTRGAWRRRREPGLLVTVFDFGDPTFATRLRCCAQDIARALQQSAVLVAIRYPDGRIATESTTARTALPARAGRSPCRLAPADRRAVARLMPTI